jgi:predicted class III extradiol MEMO1 family dioxygenase
MESKGMIREDSHAGSWYSNNYETLNETLQKNL